MPRALTDLFRYTRKWLMHGLAGWIFALVTVGILLMFMRFIGVVFQTDATALLQLHGAGYAPALDMRDVAAVFDVVRWKMIGVVFLCAGILGAGEALRLYRGRKRHPKPPSTDAR